MSEHREVPVKVNVSVDVGIAEMVQAMSDYSDRLETLESCQGDEDDDAFVFFRFPTWKETAHFLFDELLPRMSSDLRADVRLSMEAYDTDYALGRISMDIYAIKQMTEIVKELKR